MVIVKKKWAGNVQIIFLTKYNATDSPKEKCGAVVFIRENSEK